MAESIESVWKRAFDRERTELLEIDGLNVLSGDIDPVFTAVKSDNRGWYCDTCGGRLYVKEYSLRDLHDVIPQWVRDNNNKASPKASPYDRLKYLGPRLLCPNCNKRVSPKEEFAAPKARCTYRMQQYIGLGVMLSPIRQVRKSIDNQISISGIEKIFSGWLKEFDAKVHERMESPDVLGVFVIRTEAEQQLTILLDCRSGNLLDIVEPGDTDALKDRLKALQGKNKTKELFIDPYNWIYDAVKAVYKRASIKMDPLRVSETVRREASADIEAIVRKKADRKLFRDDPKQLSPRRKKKKDWLQWNNPILESIEDDICVMAEAAKREPISPRLSIFSKNLQCYWRNNEIAISNCEVDNLPDSAIDAIRTEQETLSYTNGCGLPALRARTLYTDAAENCFNDFFGIGGENGFNLRKMDGGIMYKAWMSWELNKSSRYVPIDMIPYLIAAIEPAVDVLNSEGSMREMCSHPENRDRLLKKAYQFGFPQWVVERNLAAANRLIRQQRSNRRGDAIERSAWTEEDWQK